ncbi:ATP-dependent DNA helicase RecQ [Thalassomonas sp. M1454]|uniref:RecQ family ATP-dependent DNA helicase n=1 Tax=Thalassomonas sp. M1454 TaxID=2594477 RepID=UPI0011810EC9|nr:ATP-dependent DNA helicase RecQ [Thalassomonas sp. M1454]TRX56554.1 RecQ family ATP-dependent DNA helicase [Thalassomonas sp. M1454]
MQSHQLLKQYFGFNDFRPGQQQVVEHILSGQSAAAIFPTGSGKSLCYQLPAIALPHLTLVISPLLALMQDQLEFLQARGIAAASIDSMQSKEQSQQVMHGVRSGEIKILMISVERLNNERFRQFLQQIPISLLVVDEAHCISEWGHNFRPDYLKLPKYKKQFNIAQTLLLTATATEKVIADMGNKFAISDENITLTGFYRNNLNLHVQGISQADKDNYLAHWLNDKTEQAGIVYVTLQQTAEEVARTLSAKGYQAKAYHAGMDSELRQSIQQDFMSGKVNLIVATIAFGMGIDKSDIRFVVHYDLPKSIENYAQEIGRAGRDGYQSECLVLANYDNLNILENFVYADTPEETAISYVINEIHNVTKAQSQSSLSKANQWEVVLNSLSSQSNIRLLSLKTLLVYLELAGLIKPAYSYFAEYKFKLKGSESDLINNFSGERQTFIKAIFDSSDKAKIWYTINFEKLQQLYPSERNRVISAIEYFDEKSLIELQSKQMTEVYQVNPNLIDLAGLQAKVYTQFKHKEASEIARIEHLLAFFASNTCLSLQLAHYFSDNRLQQPCGHCSVCLGHVAQMPPVITLKPLTEFNFNEYAQEIISKLGQQTSATLVSRFLCGLTTPIFTKLRVRKLKGFAVFEHYRYGEVLNWVQTNLGN